MMPTLTGLTSADLSAGWKIQPLMYWTDWRKRLRCRFLNFSRNHVLVRHRLNLLRADEGRYGSSKLGRCKSYSQKVRSSVPTSELGQ